MTAASYSSLLDSWDRQQAAYIAEREARFNAQLEVLALAAGQDFHVVDLACGPGSLSLRILQRFPQARVTAIDLDPLLLAVAGGQPEMIRILTAAKANPNIGNASGETPLIRAVQRHDIGMVRELLNAGADPDMADSVAGLSAREYASQDARNTAIAKLFADTPKKTRAAVAGPKF